MDAVLVNMYICWFLSLALNNYSVKPGKLEESAEVTTYDGLGDASGERALGYHRHPGDGLCCGRTEGPHHEQQLVIRAQRVYPSLEFTVKVSNRKSPPSEEVLH